VDAPAAAAKNGAAGTDNTAAWLEELLRVLPSYNTVVLDGARITAASQVRDSIIGLYGVVDGAVALEDVTLLSTVDQPSRCGTGAVVRGAILQEGVTVETGALVERSMLFETVHVERHGKVTESLIGPNTEIGEGEVTASVVGPFVGMHHQSLLIAALWPEGRGNIGYGANVGSNHTSRTADQEIHPGAGTFFGLGTSVKFPANFRDAPYSVIATGSTTLPQRVGFPFSLITTPMIVPADGDAADGGGGQAGGMQSGQAGGMQSGEAGGMQSGQAGGMQSGEAGGMKGREVGYPPGINQILPGWGLYANAYALFRNERKFRTRNRARRHAAPESIISPALIAAMERARDLLRSATAREAEDLQPIDWRSIPELGKNFATLADCRRGAEAYERFIHFFSLYLRLTAEDASQELSDDELVSFDGAFAEIYRIAERSRRKDVERGSRIIDDYEAVHPAVEEDAVLAWMQREIGGLSQRLREARG
jgi:hypothetical protein